MSDHMFTVGYHETLSVTVGVVDHEDEGEYGLYEQQGEDCHHSKGSHNSISFLQVVTVNLIRYQG